MSKMFQFFCVFVALSGSVAANSLFGSKEDTPLICAVKAGNIAVVKNLLKSGVDVNELGQDFKTALDVAVEYGYEEIALNLGKYKAKVTCDDNQKYLQHMFKLKAAKYSKGFALGVGLACLLFIPTVGLVIGCAMAGAMGSDVFGIIAIIIVAEVAGALHVLTLPFHACIAFKNSKQNWMLPVSDIY